MEKMTSKQRAEFRSKAQSLSPIVMVGQNGVSESVIAALDEALECHELVKVKFQDFKEDTKDLSLQLEKETASTLIATTGFTAVFYRKSEKNN